MTISTASNKVICLGNGATSTFNYDFLIPSASEAVVIYCDTSGTAQTVPASQYTITGLGSANGGTVTYAPAGAPIASGTTLTILRVVPYVQDTSLVNQSGYYPDVVEGMADDLTMQTQQLGEIAGRTIQFPGTEATPASPLLPPVAQRAGKYLGFNSSGGLAILNGASIPTFPPGTSPILDVRQFGVKMDGVTDDTSAWMRAINSDLWLYVPPGNSLVGNAVFGNISRCKIIGSGPYASKITVMDSGVGWTFSGCTDIVMQDIAFQPGAGVTGVSGCLFTGSGVGVCWIDRCQFTGFDTDGLQLIAPSSAPMSGMKVTDCLFLSNMQHGLYSSYSEDFWISGNQFGITSGHPAYGCYLDNSSAGTYTGNYHWDNVVGFYTINSNYNRIECNRFEESDHEGVHLNSGDQCIFVGNTVHTNSKASKGGYNNAAFTGMTNLLLANNNAFDWTGGTGGHQFTWAFGVGCAGLTIEGNKSQGYIVGPFFFDNSIVEAGINGNETIRFSSGGTVATNVTVFIGASAQNASVSAVEQIAGRSAVVARLSVAADTVPGAGQSFTYTVYKNGVATGMTASFSGTSQFGSASVASPVQVSADDALSVQLVTSNAAAVANHRVSLELADC